MAGIESLKSAFLNARNTFQWRQFKTLLVGLGYGQIKSGKTAGSKRRFYNSTIDDVITLDEPHDGVLTRGYDQKAAKAPIGKGIAMSVVEYKEYQGEVTYEEGRLHVKVLHVSDFLSAECDRASDVDSVFQNLIDQYLADCADLGRNPNKPFKGSFSIRVGPDLHKRAALAAKRADISLNSWVIAAINNKLLGEEKSRGTKPEHIGADVEKSFIDAVMRSSIKHVDVWQRPSRYSGFALTSSGDESLSRTRFPWTQNWLNRSVQGGPEHDR